MFLWITASRFLFGLFSRREERKCCGPEATSNGTVYYYLNWRHPDYWASYKSIPLVQEGVAKANLKEPHRLTELLIEFGFPCANHLSRLALVSPYKSFFPHALKVRKTATELAE